MPLTLILRTSGAPAKESDGPAPALTFDGPRVVIGRGAGCDVRLPDPSVSHRHATVRANGSDHLLQDEGSTNGTFVGGVKLSPNTPRPIKNGDLVRVGRVWLEARIDQTPATRDLALATRDLALALVSQAMRGLGQDASTKVRVIEGRDEGAVIALEDEGRAYVIGRDATCDLPLADVDVSREHAQVARRGSTVLVRDLASKNGVWLGDVRLAPDRDVPWRAGAQVRLGNTAMQLEEPALLALADLEAAEDEPIAPEDVPPSPAPSTPTSLLSTGGPSSARHGGAPIANVPSAPPPRAQGGPRWSGIDLAVVVAALAVLGLSIVGLFWLLRT